MKRQTISFLAVALSALASAQGALQSEVLYHSGEVIKDQGLMLKNWGSGTISQTDETSYEGAYSIQISTRNYFQGGILDYQSPQDIAGKFENKNNLLQITFKTADETARGFTGGPANRPGTGRGIPGSSGNGPGFPGGGFPGAGRTTGGFPGGGGGQAFPGGGQSFPGGGPGRGAAGAGAGRFGGGQGQGRFGGPGGPGAASTTGPTPMKNLRLIVTTSDGKKSEVYIPIDTSTSADRGWKSVAIPLQAITGLDRTNKVVKQIAFSGDGTSTFYVGDLRVVNDSTPIHGEIENQSFNFAAGDSVVFHGTGTGGSTVLKFSWDFGANNGIQEDAVGQTVTRKFRKPGKYHVTLTISDLYGLKPSYSTSIDVTVNG